MYAHMTASKLTNTRTIFDAHCDNALDVEARLKSMREYARGINLRMCVTIAYTSGVVRSIRI